MPLDLHGFPSFISEPGILEKNEAEQNPRVCPHTRPVTSESPGMGGRVWMCGFDSCSGNSCAARIENL